MKIIAYGLGAAAGVAQGSDVEFPVPLLLLLAAVVVYVLAGRRAF
jgi:uncharacterized protein (DUF2062 family)